jgi:hypothetical protein
LVFCLCKFLCSVMLPLIDILPFVFLLFIDAHPR